LNTEIQGFLFINLHNFNADLNERFIFFFGRVRRRNCPKLKRPDQENHY
jgi:hypothetical protein